MSAPGWLRRLSRTGARLAPDPRGGFAVFPGGDRRRRALARLDAAGLKAALADGLIEADGEARWAISEAGLARVRRADAAPERAFADQHRTLGAVEIETPEGRLQRATADLSASPLARYAKARGGAAAALSPIQVAAGERLRADYERSTLSTSVTADWTRPPRGKSPRAPHDPAGAPVSRLAAKDRVMDALAAAGPGLDRLLVNVCLRETGMTKAERALGWPERAGLPALAMALERLAVFYGLKAPDAPADPFRGVS